MGLIDEIKRDIPSILGGDTKKLVEDAEKLGEHLGRRLSTSQIRIIFSEVKQMQEYDRDKLNLSFGSDARNTRNRFYGFYRSVLMIFGIR